MEKRNAGFTLLELVIALCLFSIGMMGIIALSGGVIKGNMVSMQRSIAIQLAQNKMETLLSAEYSDVEDSLEEALDATETLGTGIFNREVIVFDMSGPSCKSVTVSVKWKLAEEHHETIHCIIAAP